MVKYFAEIKSEPISEVETINLFGINDSSEADYEFVRIKEAISYKPVLNVKIKSDYSPTFKQVEIINDLIIVGYGNKFGLYNFNEKYKIIELTFEGYFGSFKVDRDDIFIATDSEIFDLNLKGEIKWMSDILGIDGVIIGKITESEIEGNGEWDPPGGWRPFLIDRLTGRKV